MFEQAPNGHFLQDMIIFGGLRKGGHVAKGFIFEPPDLSTAAPAHLNEFQDQISLLLASLLVSAVVSPARPGNEWGPGDRPGPTVVHVSQSGRTGRFNAGSDTPERGELIGHRRGAGPAGVTEVEDALRCLGIAHDERHEGGIGTLFRVVHANGVTGERVDHQPWPA